MLFLLVDKNSKDLDDKVMNHIKNFDKSKYMPKDELKRYFTYVRTLTARVPKELESRIDDLYRKMRPYNTSGITPIGIRQYYGLYRLVTACAVCNLREEVNESDISRVENMVFKSLESFGIDMKTGKVEDKFHKKKDNRSTYLL